MPPIIFETKGVFKMEDKTYKITLADGTELENLSLNGNNFITDEDISEEKFLDNLSPVTINDGDTDDVHDNMALVQISKIGGKNAFILRDLTAAELKEIKIRADIEYIAMMAEIEL